MGYCGPGFMMLEAHSPFSSPWEGLLLLPTTMDTLYRPLSSAAISTAITVASLTGPGWALPLLCHQRKLETPQVSWESSSRAWAGSSSLIPPQQLLLWIQLFLLVTPTLAYSSQWFVPDGPLRSHISTLSSPAPSSLASHRKQ